MCFFEFVSSTNSKENTKTLYFEKERKFEVLNLITKEQHL